MCITYGIQNPQISEQPPIFCVEKSDPNFVETISSLKCLLHWQALRHISLARSMLPVNDPRLPWLSHEMSCPHITSHDGRHDSLEACKWACHALSPQTSAEPSFARHVPRCSVSDKELKVGHESIFGGILDEDVDSGQHQFAGYLSRYNQAHGYIHTYVSYLIHTWMSGTCLFVQTLNEICKLIR